MAAPVKHLQGAESSEPSASSDISDSLNGPVPLPKQCEGAGLRREQASPAIQAILDLPVLPAPGNDQRHQISGDALPKASPSESGRTTDNPWFVEVFAGSAMLSHSMRSKGFQTLAVDAPNNRHKSLVPGTVFDLTSKACQKALIEMITSKNKLAGIHCGLPCGTGSRAREKPLSPKLLAQGAPQPRPLRDCDHVLGLPGLSANERSRVDAANELARYVVELLRLSIDLGCFFSIENPLNSWMWAVLAHYVRESKDKKLSRVFGAMTNVDFSMCMWGGDRPKSTRFKCTRDFLSSMAKDCDGSHVHKPYTIFKDKGDWKFDTAAEAEYPQKLCDEIAQLFAKEIPLNSQEPVKRPCVRQTRRHSQLIPEFKKVVDCKPDPFLAFKTLAPSDKSHGEKFGIFHTKEEFCAAAEKVPHPAETFGCIPDAAKENVFRLLTAGVCGTAKERIANQTMIMQTMQELRVEEARLHASLPAHVQQVLRGKNLLLWHHLLKKTGFADLGVWDLMLGTDIVGAPSKSALYGWKEKPPALSAQGLLQSATWRRHRMSQTSVHSDDPGLQATLWEMTLHEVRDCRVLSTMSKKCKLLCRHNLLCAIVDV